MSKRKLTGIVLIIIGFIALITPLTPGSWLVFVGLELLGVRFLLWQKIKSKFKKGENNVQLNQKN